MGEINSGDLFEDGVAVDLHGTLLAVTSFFFCSVSLLERNTLCVGAFYRPLIINYLTLFPVTRCLVSQR